MVVEFVMLFLDRLDPVEDFEEGGLEVFGVSVERLVGVD